MKTIYIQNTLQLIQSNPDTYSELIEFLNDALLTRVGILKEFKSGDNIITYFVTEETEL